MIFIMMILKMIGAITEMISIHFNLMDLRIMKNPIKPAAAKTLTGTQVTESVMK